jgi:NDP-sugar pyrophosphorylase family protein
LPALVDADAVRAAPLHGTFTDIGVPEDYRRFSAEHA